MSLGNPEYECDLQPLDLAKVADGMGIPGFRIESTDQCGPRLKAAFAEAGPALVDARVDPNEPLLPPKRMPKYAENLEKGLAAETPGADQTGPRSTESRHDLPRGPIKPTAIRALNLRTPSTMMPRLLRGGGTLRVHFLLRRRDHRFEA